MKYPLALQLMVMATAKLAFSPSTVILVSATTTTPTPTPLEILDEALLTDLIEQYITHETTTCTSSASVDDATSFSFDWPGTNAESAWYESFEQFEQGNFQAIMSHTDGSGDRSWSIRIGVSGNMYSHYAGDMWGETIPPQRHAQVRIGF